MTVFLLSDARNRFDRKINVSKIICNPHISNTNQTLPKLFSLPAVGMVPLTGLLYRSQLISETTLSRRRLTPRVNGQLKQSQRLNRNFMVITQVSGLHRDGGRGGRREATTMMMTAEEPRSLMVRWEPQITRTTVYHRLWIFHGSCQGPVFTQNLKPQRSA